MAKKKTEKSFKDEMNALDEIISKLESGDLELEDSINAYGEGVKLIDSLNRKLNDSKLKIVELMGKIENDGFDEGDE